MIPTWVPGATPRRCSTTAIAARVVVEAGPLDPVCGGTTGRGADECDRCVAVGSSGEARKD